MQWLKQKEEECIFHNVSHYLFPLGMSSWLQKSLSHHPDQAEYKGHNANFI